MNVIRNENIQRDEWLTFLSKNAFASPFQSPDFVDFLKDVNDQSAEVIAIKDENGSIASLAVIVIQKEQGIKKYFSTRGIIFGGPLFTDQSSSEFLVRELVRHFKRKLIYLEVRNFFDYSNYNSAYSNWTFNKHLNVQINTPDFEDLEAYLKSLKYNRRREIKQSLKNGATYSICNKEHEVREIYEILKELYDTRVKLPLPSFDFFKQMLNNDSFIIFKVVHQNKVIGGAFCPVLKNEGIYTMYYCGIRNYHKKIFPTHLAVLATIDYSLEKNLKKVDLMGAGKPDEKYGVRKYKEQFGGNTVQHGRYLNILNPFLFALAKLGLSIIQKLK